MILLGRCVRQCVRTARGRQVNNESSDKENETDTSSSSQTEQDSSTVAAAADNELTADNTETMALLLETVVVLWEGVAPQLRKPVHANHKDNLRKAYRHLLREIFHGFTDTRVCSCLVLLAGFLPPNAIPTFSIGTLSKLKALPVDCKEEAFSTMVQSMCRWCKGHDLVDMLSDWLSKTYTANEMAALTDGVKKRGVTFAAPVKDDSKSVLALRILNYLMRENECQALLLQTAKAQLTQLASFLHNVMVSS